MGKDNKLPTEEEIFEILKRTKIPTVLVEGKYDIIFYRKIEEELKDIGIDMLPAGNKSSVLKIKDMISHQKLSVKIAFIVDNDIWIHTGIPKLINKDRLIITRGYSIENDLFVDGDIIEIMDENERNIFDKEIRRFSKWYALSIDRAMRGIDSIYRTHPSKILDDKNYYEEQLALLDNEEYPHNLYDTLLNDYKYILRGKSLFSILTRQLSRRDRKTKFSAMHLMEIGASRKGENFRRISRLVRDLFNLDGNFLQQ